MFWAKSSAKFCSDTCRVYYCLYKKEGKIKDDGKPMSEDRIPVRKNEKQKRGKYVSTEEENRIYQRLKNEVK